MEAQAAAALAAALAATHAACFRGAPRPWSDAEFADLLGLDTTLLAGDAEAFVLGRVAADEAEVLTVAVRPGLRRRGRARAALAAFEAAAQQRGAGTVWLEVGEDNGAARALYAAAGYRAAGHRRDYYGPAARGRLSALVLRKELGPAPRGEAQGRPPD